MFISCSDPGNLVWKLEDTAKTVVTEWVTAIVLFLMTLFQVTGGVGKRGASCIFGQIRNHPAMYVRGQCGFLTVTSYIFYYISSRYRSPY